MVSVSCIHPGGIRTEIASGTPTTATVAWALQESSDNSTFTAANDNTGTAIGSTITTKTVAADVYARVEGVMVKAIVHQRDKARQISVGGFAVAPGETEHVRRYAGGETFRDVGGRCPAGHFSDDGPEHRCIDRRDHDAAVGRSCEMGR